MRSTIAASREREGQDPDSAARRAAAAMPGNSLRRLRYEASGAYPAATICSNRSWSITLLFTNVV